ncbi:MAG: hypothetical protein P8181_08765 [bacterium]
MRKVLPLLILTVLLVSCSKTKKPDIVLSDAGYPISYENGFYVTLDVPVEDIWWTLLEVLERYGWPIESAVEDTGTIRTELVTMGTNRDKYACRQWPGSTARVDQLRARLYIRVAAHPNGTSTLEINAGIEGRYVTAGAGTVERVAGWFPCTSTGEIEGEVFDAVLGRLEPIWYDNSVYRRGAPTR